MDLTEDLENIGKKDFGYSLFLNAKYEKMLKFMVFCQ